VLTPSQYKNRYETIDITPKDGHPVKVKVNKYRLAPGMVNTVAREAFLGMLRRRGVDTSLRIDSIDGITHIDPRVNEHEEALKKHRRDFLLSGGNPRDSLLPGASPQDLVLSRKGLFREARSLGRTGADRYETRSWFPSDTHVVDWNTLARYVFVGKASPEACQAVLQLANSWDLAPDVQAYADSAMGLDCNGFVGNYIWHVMGKDHPWTSLGVGNLDLGPDSPLFNGYFDHYKGHLIDRWESLDTTKMYIMMEVDTTGKVINGGTASATDAGHIVITEPNRRQQRPGGDPAKSFAVWAVEATAGHTPEGLWESWYTCSSYSSATKVFHIVRESMDSGHTTMDVKIAAVN
jgi:hypothetical protein